MKNLVAWLVGSGVPMGLTHTLSSTWSHSCKDTGLVADGFGSVLDSPPASHTVHWSHPGRRAFASCGAYQLSGPEPQCHPCRPHMDGV